MHEYALQATELSTFLEKVSQFDEERAEELRQLDMQDWVSVGATLQKLWCVYFSGIAQETTIRDLDVILSHSRV